MQAEQPQDLTSAGVACFALPPLPRRKGLPAKFDDNNVIAYYCLSSGIVTSNAATAAIKRNMPREIPMILLGRLAVDTHYTGKGIGRALVKDALQRALQAADIIGVRGVLVDALSPTAKIFWVSSIGTGHNETNGQDLRPRNNPEANIDNLIIYCHVLLRGDDQVTVNPSFRT
ncbi:MAG: GNAT family N-acetyltransferase [Aeromonas sp.]